MKTTRDKYQKLCDMELIQKENYTIDSRIDIIMDEIIDYLDKLTYDLGKAYKVSEEAIQDMIKENHRLFDRKSH